ncbi:type II toxin-antitoxin system RelE/ParE family toxin [Anthocerotibacter panamensis]|uniref:type II toxin-antitoxin system RelE/ParE family toxin n=1 Tax=Anthocerotibacter panamensis TaxID=2857077 RepID=UPI001C4027EB|nr:type II toxin-antitoxin system RelE/ParE family toxin [Anthocerotibacter panamensis]
MGVFRLTELAKADLRAIGRYTQQTWGRDQRNSYLARLDKSFQRLAEEPERGRPYDEIRAGYRKYHVGRHLIFYREAQDSIEIVRILHDRMDIETHLSDD